ncbi:hypothetical protein UPYG_G00341820 [Umbra pygmaea]|uniref:Uncharacterized protein n=1 Tax=Umbra pygmaea TaxID=75934 RepID=A0ABD0VX46_UMBPY
MLLLDALWTVKRLNGMNSLAMSTKWPSYNSLPDTPSFLLSESDVTEDEAEIDVFTSESEGDSSGGGKTLPFSLVGAGEAATRLRWSMAGSGQAECFSRTATYTSTMAAQGCAALSTEGSTKDTTKGDLAFAQKCSELQRFISPLLELLNGLKMGRFQRSLSSFQSSVAIDRLQRILGILQKPAMGEKFLHTLLQVEMMLKMWFPHVTPVAATQNVKPSLPARWHKNQLCMPVKKRKLSWLDSDFPSAASPTCKCLKLQNDYQEVISRDSSPLSAFVGHREHEGCFTTETYSLSRLTVSRRKRGNKKLDVSPCFDKRISSNLAVTLSPQRCHSGPGSVKSEGMDSRRRSQLIPKLQRSVKQEMAWSTGT